MASTVSLAGALLAVVILGGCAQPREPLPIGRLAPQGHPVAAIDTTVSDDFVAAGVAGPVQVATLGTRIMGTVTAVLVHEGDHVASGQLLVRLDARDLDARRVQVEAGLAEATAVRHDASTQAGRMRGLYADSAATRAQLDQAETGLARAEAALAAARGQAAELAATASYAEIRAPFAGTVTRRSVDPGSFATPGSPLVTVEDAATLRITVSAALDAVRRLRRGAPVTAGIADTAVRATIEGVVPAGANLYSINALVPNPGGRFQSGSPATLLLPRGTRRAVLIPVGSVVHQGDLTGVQTVRAGQQSLRWVTLGRVRDGLVEVLSGVARGDTVLVAAGDR